MSAGDEELAERNVFQVRFGRHPVRADLQAVGGQLTVPVERGQVERQALDGDSPRHAHRGFIRIPAPGKVERSGSDVRAEEALAPALGEDTEQRGFIRRGRIRREEADFLRRILAAGPPVDFQRRVPEVARDGRYGQENRTRCLAICAEQFS